jgi:hypothetical protein
MELINRNETFLTQVIDQLTEYNCSEVSVRSTLISIYENRYINNSPLIFESLVVYRANKISNPEVDVRLFKIGEFYFLYIYYYVGNTIINFSSHTVEDYKWCLPSEISIEKIYLFEIGQGGKSAGGKYIRREHEKEIKRFLVRVVEENLEIFEKIQDSYNTREKIYGAMFDMLDLESKRKYLQLYLAE